MKERFEHLPDTLIEEKEGESPRDPLEAAADTLTDTCKYVKEVLNDWFQRERKVGFIQLSAMLLSLAYSITPYAVLFASYPRLIRPLPGVPALITLLANTAGGMLALEDFINAFQVHWRLRKSPPSDRSPLIEEIKRQGREDVDSASLEVLVWLISEVVSYFLVFSVYFGLSILPRGHNPLEGPTKYLLSGVFLVNMLASFVLLLLTISLSPPKDHPRLVEACRKFIQEECDTEKPPK